MSAASCLSALALAEAMTGERVFISLDAGEPAFDAKNVVGADITVERGADFESLVLRAKEASESGQRVALIGSAPSILASRRALRALVLSRLGVVVHVLADPNAMRGAVYGLLDLGFVLLFSSGPQDSLDLTAIARRAAEDAGLPIFVVHEHGALASFEAVVSPEPSALAAYVGLPRARLVRISDPKHPVFVNATERAFAKRAAFALSAAMRELEAVSGRRHDTMERVAPEADVTLVGLGAVGDALLGVAERSRGSSNPVGALKITAVRPLDGPRIVKSLMRTHAITVIEAGFDPLTETMPLARELKAAFTDAVTWAPGYPGVGRVPRVSSAVVGQGGLTADHIAAAIANMRDGEHGPRSFVFGEEDAPQPPSGRPQIEASTPRIRIACADEASAAKLARCILSAIAAAVGLRARIALRSGEGGLVNVDVSTSREVARAEAERSAFDWVLHQRDKIAETAALAAAFIAHGNRVVVDGPQIARAIARTTGNQEDEASARNAVESGRWRTRAE